MFKDIFVLVVCISIQAPLLKCDVHVFVSPRGSDSHDGLTDTTPVKTIPKGLAVASLSKYNNETVYIELMHGFYDLTRTLYLSRSNTIVRSYKNQEVRVTGGHRIPTSAIKHVTDSNILSRLPAKSRAHVRVVNLHDLNIKNFGHFEEYGSGLHRHSSLEMTFNGQPLHVARWPDKGYIDIVDVPDGRNGLKFRYNSTVPQFWHNESDPWVYGFWYYCWSDRSVKVTSINSTTNTVTLAKHAFRGMRKGHWQEYQDGVSNHDGGYFYFINILGALDQPGEYYMDRENGKLYFIPPNQNGNVAATDVIYVSILNDCIVIPSHKQNVQLQDFTLEICRRSGIYAPNVNKVKVLNMQIRNTGGLAMSFTGDSRENEISSCFIQNTCGGILMNGGNRRQLESSGNIITNNEIARFTRVGVIGNYAISVSGVGHTIKTNHIYDGKYGAIHFSGNDIAIENNLIHHVCKDAGGCGAIMSGGDWTYRGNTIHRNIVHDVLRLIPGLTCQAVRLDQQVSGTSVMYNSFYNNTEDIFIGGGRDNEIVNNVMYNAEIRSIYVDYRGLNHHGDPDLHKRLDAMPYNSSLWSLRYPKLANILSKNASLPEGNQISRNVMYAREHTEYIHGLTRFLSHNTPKYFNITQTIFSTGSADHFSVKDGDLRVRCSLLPRANRVHFIQPSSPNSVGPYVSPIGPMYIHRGRVHLVNTTYPSNPCTTQVPNKNPPRAPYLPDASGNYDLYPVEHIGCWLNITKCRHHTASVGTYRDMYGERYRHAADNETMCFRRAIEQWHFCGSHRDETVVAIYGPTGAATLGGSGCMRATYGCPKHGGPIGVHGNTTLGAYQNDNGFHSEKSCLGHALGYWRYCGSNPKYPITYIYLPTGAKRTAGGGCWITVKHCPAHPNTKVTFYDAFGSTNFQTDYSEFACHNQAEYYWDYCGSDAKYPVKATYRPTTASKTFP
ncbi:uncharacterized protein LOC132728289 [Ruditapes philippinarum]|uniref:uncharacterized protein LOC132728289 n=1 Tax=Ruditapes philippinarum TaxID=129788 RepID=UPI00295B313C|nr:uncharacterized protein LOC132728289 [Ruditapes philippinarum]